MIIIIIRIIIIIILNNAQVLTQRISAVSRDIRETAPHRNVVFIQSQLYMITITRAHAHHHTRQVAKLSLKSKLMASVCLFLFCFHVFVSGAAANSFCIANYSFQLILQIMVGSKQLTTHGGRLRRFRHPHWFRRCLNFGQ